MPSLKLYRVLFFKVIDTNRT